MTRAPLSDDVLAVSPPGSRAFDVPSWRQAGLAVTGFQGDALALTEALDARRFAALAVSGLTPALAFALERTRANASTRVLWFVTREDDAGVLRRFAGDPRVTFVHRSLSARSRFPSVAQHEAVVPWGGDETTPPRQGAPGLLWPHAIDASFSLVVRTAWAMGDEASRVRWLVNAPVPAEWTGGLRFERGEHPQVVLLAQPDVREAVEWTARGAVVLAVDDEALREVLPAAQLLPLADPALFAQRARQVIAGELSAPRVGQTRAAQIERELTLLRAKPWRPTPHAAPQPLLTVVVPAFDAEAHLERCVASLSRQTAEDLEVIIVDDGSRDGTPGLADALANEQVRVVHQANAGHGGAINTGLTHARGRWFKVVDADDWLEPDAFGALLSALRTETAADLVLCDYSEVRPELELPRRVPLFERLPVGGLCGFEGLTHPQFGLSSWGPILSTSTFRTEVLRRAGLRLTERSFYVDMEYCTLGLEHVERFRVLDLELYRYSLGSAQQSVSPESYRKRFRQHEAVLTRLCDFVQAGKPSEAKRDYVVARVITPLIDAHLRVLRDELDDAAEEAQFRERFQRFAFVQVPQRPLTARARAALKKRLPPSVREPLARLLRGLTR